MFPSCCTFLPESRSLRADIKLGKHAGPNRLKEVHMQSSGMSRMMKAGNLGSAAGSALGRMQSKTNKWTIL